VYFAPNTVQGFVDAVTRAVHDQQNRPSVISIRWGTAELNWTDQGLAAMNTAFKDAAQLNVTVLAASGDDLATDGESDGRAHTDFPSSSRFVIGCGGTVIDTNGGSITSEKVWNHNGSGTGGGISDKFDLPGYQAKANIPKSVNDEKVRRGVPDIAGDADPASGFSVVVGGIGGTIGGTSAVAPLFAGFFALINEACTVRLDLPFRSCMAVQRPSVRSSAATTWTAPLVTLPAPVPDGMPARVSACRTARSSLPSSSRRPALRSQPLLEKA
jgi:kumamolisin